MSTTPTPPPGVPVTVVRDPDVTGIGSVISGGSIAAVIMDGTTAVGLTVVTNTVNPVTVIYE